MSNSQSQKTRKRGSLFGPLILIALGVIFLLNNINVLPGDLWGTLLQFWPLILVAIGLDNIFQREGLVGATFMIGLGVVFLLSNLGYINTNIWQLILRLWPLLLVAIGLDLVVGRRSIWASLAGLVVLLVLLVGALLLFGVNVETGQVLQGESISQSFDGARSGEVILDNAVGDVYIQAGNDPALLVSGTVTARRGVGTSQEFSIQGEEAVYRLRQSGAYVGIGNAGSRTWDIGLNRNLPISLRYNQGAGLSILNLDQVQISYLDANIGVGQLHIILPQNGDFEGKISGAIGQIVIEVPSGVGIRIRSDGALVTVHTPDGYEKLENSYTSPDYDSAEFRMDLQINLAIGDVRVTD